MPLKICLKCFLKMTVDSKAKYMANTLRVV